MRGKAMFVIGLETSGFVGSIALLRDGQIVHEQSLGEAGRRHAQSLVHEIRELLSLHSAKSKDVSLVAVSKGPGSFTGLRVGMVCAKTFAYATRSQFAAIDTFEVVANNCPGGVSEVWVVENAQRGEFFAAKYQRQNDGCWIQMTPIQIVSAPEWLTELSPDEVVTGPGLLGTEDWTSPARLLTDPDIARPRAATVAMLGFKKVHLTQDQHLGVDRDFWKAIPFYVRPSAAEEKRAANLKSASN